MPGISEALTKTRLNDLISEVDTTKYQQMCNKDPLPLATWSCVAFRMKDFTSLIQDGKDHSSSQIDKTKILSPPTPERNEGSELLEHRAPATILPIETLQEANIKMY